MDILKKNEKEKMTRDDIWDSMPEYKVLGMSEEDIDMSILDEDEE